MVQPRGQSRQRAGPVRSCPHTHPGHSTCLTETLGLPCLKTRFTERFMGQPGSPLPECLTLLLSVPEPDPHLKGSALWFSARKKKVPKARSPTSQESRKRITTNSYVFQSFSLSLKTSPLPFTGYHFISQQHFPPRSHLSGLLLWHCSLDATEQLNCRAVTYVMI